MPIDGEPVRLVDVAICTYRRDSLGATLASIAAQNLPRGMSLSVTVADNDDEPHARARITDMAARLGLDCHYVHAPARNISIARNACLDATSAPVVAFIDDDEVATPGWLAALIARLDETGADAVLGPARALYPPGAPTWTVKADLHSTAPPITTTGAIRTGYSCNVLFRRATMEGLRFDPALGRTGGEDDMFFAAAVRRGARLAYAPAALVDDPVPPARLTLAWLCRRSFRNGQTHARNLLADGVARMRALPVTAAKAVACLAGAVLLCWSPHRWRRLVVRAMLHLGASARLLGWRELQLY